MLGVVVQVKNFVLMISLSLSDVSRRSLLQAQFDCSIQQPDVSCSPFLVVIEILGYKKTRMLSLFRPPSNNTPTMSSLKTSAAITDVLRQQYRATLLQIKKDLNNDQKEELRFYCTDFIPEETMGILKLFRSLEYVQKISWEDVGFLKKGLYAVRRLDLVEILTGYENKRDLTKLIAGEIVADSLASEGGRHSLKPEVIERCWSAADELYCLMRRHEINWVSCQIYPS